MAVYEDFEPFCKWQKDQGHDTLEVHLQGFRKDQMKIQLSNIGVMVISGQRPLDDYKSVWSRFRKELKLSKDYKSNEIHAKLSGGVLYIVMPKIIPLTSTSTSVSVSTIQEQPEMPPENQGNERNSVKRKYESDNAENILKKSYGGYRIGDLVNNKKIVGNIAVGIALAIVMGAFAIIYKYRQPTYVVDH
ncbi:HSP20-like chaperones superfamily protein [Euphorbia peplus]|nr:HSP20-like chaperones superfamily protein [Euphorbia peplus]